MKKFIWVGPVALLVYLAFAPQGCTTSAGSPTATPQPTATMAPNTVGASGTSFVPTSLTITHGTTVTFDSSLSGHTVNIDNSSGSCLTDFTSGFPHTYTFSTAGTYYVHCDIHSSCGASNCSTSCTGMVMTITAN